MTTPNSPYGFDGSQPATFPDFKVSIGGVDHTANDIFPAQAPPVEQNDTTYWGGPVHVTDLFFALGGLARRRNSSVGRDSSGHQNSF